MLGLGVLAVIAVRHREWFRAIPTGVRKNAVIVVCANIGLAICYGLIRAKTITGILSLARPLGISIVTFFALLGVEATVAGLAWKLTRKVNAGGNKA